MSSTDAAGTTTTDPACGVAHGDVPGEDRTGRLVAVYATPVSEVLLRWGRELGFETVLLEPVAERVTARHREGAGAIVHEPGAVAVDEDTDVVVTDHHRDDLGATMAPVVTAQPRWIGIMGSPRHTPVHPDALRREGVDEEHIRRVRRPIGLDIGSRAPAEIALATLAGLLADRNHRTGGPMA